MGWVGSGCSCHFTTRSRIPVQDYRAQFIRGGLHFGAHSTLPSASRTLHTLHWSMALCHLILASSESTDQTTHLLYEAEPTSKAYCQEIRHIIFHHLCYFHCSNRRSTRRWYVSSHSIRLMSRKQSPDESGWCSLVELGSHSTRQWQPKSDYACKP